MIFLEVRDSIAAQVIRRRGELRVWDNEMLMGWYAAVDGPVRSKRTIHQPKPSTLPAKAIRRAWDATTSSLERIIDTARANPVTSLGKALS
jgi:hypothetical protein